MIEGSNILGYSNSKKGNQVFHAPNPNENGELPEEFVTATHDEIDEAVVKARNSL